VVACPNHSEETVYYDQAIRNVTQYVPTTRYFFKTSHESIFRKYAQSTITSNPPICIVSFAQQTLRADKCFVILTASRTLIR